VGSTAPTSPGVADDGAYTTSTAQLQAIWTCSVPESGITEYQYAIGTTAGGTNVVNWTSTGTTTSVTRTGLSLTNGARYFISVKARNGASAWSVVGSSDGITVDSTAPTTPVVTDDGIATSSTTQLHATWTSSDPESNVAEYQYQITRDSATGTVIVPWTATGTTASVTKTGLTLTHGKTYYFSVKAKNGAGTWSSTGTSNGIIVDSTSPTTPVVTDDGVYTSSVTQLHATWTSSEPESGVVEYQYQVTQDSSAGVVVVDWTSTGTATEVTKAGLTLTHGKSYYFSVKAKNGAGSWSQAGSSDGIVVDENAPAISGVTPADGTAFTEGDSVTITATASDLDGDPLGYQFLVDGAVTRAWSSSAAFAWDTAGKTKLHTITVQVRDGLGRQTESQIKFFGYRRPVSPPS